MRRAPAGKYLTIKTNDESFRAFVPASLPPRPPLEWPVALRQQLDEALLALGRLDAVTRLLPNAALVLYSFVRKEAVLSSQIEGTQSTLADLLLFEIDEQPGVPVADTHEVSRYVAALETGLQQMRRGLPLCMRVLCSAHAALMKHPGGRSKAPGEIRRTQVWVGGTRPGNAAFVPPPPNEVAACLQALEHFINDQPEPTPSLVKAALAHVQFETIHPFLDGNGRLGRLLIVLQFVADGVLREPMLYPSLYFKRHHALYYELLNDVRLHGDWERWLGFFADAVRESATEAVITAHDLLKIVDGDRDAIARLGRPAASALAVHHALQRQPIASTAALVDATGLTAATVNKSLRHLIDLKVATELTSRQRGRVFCYRRYVECLNRDLKDPAA